MFDLEGLQRLKSQVYILGLDTNKKNMKVPKYLYIYFIAMTFTGLRRDQTQL